MEKENLSEIEKKDIPTNYQYVRGNISKIEAVDNGIKLSVAVNMKDKEPTFIDVLAYGGNSEKVTKLDAKIGEFVEVSGQFEFATIKDKEETYHVNNTIFLNNIKKHQLEKGVSVDFNQKHDNTIKLKANLVSEPTFKTLESGTKLAIMNVANNNSYQDKTNNSEWVQKVTYVEVAAFGKEAENLEAQNLKKGDPLKIEGRVNKADFTNKEGKKQFKASVVGTSVSKDLDIAIKREAAKKKDNSKDKKGKIAM